MICVRSGLRAELAAVLLDEHPGANVSAQLDRLQFHLLCFHRHFRTPTLASYLPESLVDIVHTRFTLQSTKVLNSLNPKFINPTNQHWIFKEHKSELFHHQIDPIHTCSPRPSSAIGNEGTKRIGAVEITNI